MNDLIQILRTAQRAGMVVPAFNIPYLPMMAPVVQAIRECNSFGLIAVARLEWIKFQAGGLKDVKAEYDRCADRQHTRLHLDHVPVLDEDGQWVDYEPIIAEALERGYDSVMIDGSRLTLNENIAATRRVVRMAHRAGAACEGELGAVLGHESGPMPSYEQLYASGRGFTDPDQAREFVEKTEVDWLSVAIGNIHGAVSGAARSGPKVRARLNIEHLRRIGDQVDRPLVLHGGSGIAKPTLQHAFREGIAKINIGTDIRQPYEQALQRSPGSARQAVYEAALAILTTTLEANDTAVALVG